MFSNQIIGGNMTQGSSKSKELFTAISDGDNAKVKELLAQDKSVLNERNNNGYTPLTYAVTNINLEIVKTLVDNKADLNAQNSEGQTAAYLAATLLGNDEITQYLLNNGADVNIPESQRGNTIMHFVASVDPNHVGGENALSNIINHLVTECGADINKKNLDGNTPLLIAASKKKFATVDALIQNGADQNIQNSDGRSFAHYAAPDLNIKYSKKLSKEGADLSLKDKDGKTAADVAFDSGRTHAAGFLKAEAATQQKADDMINHLKNSHTTQSVNKPTVPSTRSNIKRQNTFKGF